MRSLIVASFLISSLLFLSYPSLGRAAKSIDDYGAKSNDDSLEASATNAKAIMAALIDINNSTDIANDRTLIIPKGFTYGIVAITLNGLHNITLQIDGNLQALDDIKNWPTSGSGHNTTYMDVFRFQSCSNIRLSGSGNVDGRGYSWWEGAILATLKSDHRPHLFTFNDCVDIVIEDVRFKDSPSFHINLEDCADVRISRISIMVDVTRQKSLLMKHRKWHLGLSIPTFPLNTDGIDPQAKNVLIEDSFIQSFDDSVAVKPCHGGYRNCQCAENILVRNMRTSFGVGMTIGSVPPNALVNCVRNVTFQNILMDKPIKGVYIKTNPGDSGSGIIDNITYENVTMNEASWWAIYIGPQQQHQPNGGANTGCSFLYPYHGECPTQPRVPITNVVIRNMFGTYGIQNPGLMRCSPGKCSGFVFDNVNLKRAILPSLAKYYTENISGTSQRSLPNPHFAPEN